MRQFLIGVLLATMMLAFNSPIAQADPNPTVYLDGSQLYFDVPAQIINSRCMVPMGKIFQALGASISWDGSTQTVRASKDSITLEITIGSYSYYLNGEANSLDVPAQLIDGRTMVPLAIVAMGLQCQIGYDGNNNMVSINSGISPTSISQRKYQVAADSVDESTISLKLDSGCSWYTGPESDIKLNMQNGQLNYEIYYPNQQSSKNGGDLLVIRMHGGDLPKNAGYTYRFTVDGLKVILPNSCPPGDLNIVEGGTATRSYEYSADHVVTNAVLHSVTPLPSSPPDRGISAPFGINEAFPGGLSSIHLSLPAGVRFSGLPNPSVSGDIVLDMQGMRLENNGRELIISITQKSYNCASSIYFGDCLLDIDPSVPEGNIRLTLNGTSDEVIMNVTR